MVNPRNRLAALAIAACALFSIGSQPHSKGALESRSIVGAIVYVGIDNNIHFCSRGGCAKPECLTCPIPGTHVRSRGGFVAVGFVPAQDEENGQVSGYGWPAFSPNGKMIAYSATTRRRNGSASDSVWVYELAKHSSTRLFEAQNEHVIYVDWLPDGAHVSFLLAEPHGLSLVMAETRERVPVRIVATGMPLYYAWSATGDRIVVHTRGMNEDRPEQVAMLSLTPTSQKVDKVIASGRSSFKTPSWSPDRRHLAYVANHHAASNLIVADADATNPHSVVSLPVGESTFIWAPDSRHIAYSTAVVGERGVFHGLDMVDISDSTSRRMTNEDLMAFFFSPDGKWIAGLGVPAERPYATWSVINTATAKNRTLTSLLTTDEEANAYRFFDQLALSHTIWAPDSSAIVFAGVPVDPKVEPPPMLAPQPQVWILPIDGSPPRSIGSGLLVFYSPAAS
jgi:dipeptidyl aminopeptidase/acylaminoacyl peptidase